MSINAATIPQYSDTDMLNIYRWALANGAAGQTRSIQGRSITFPGIKDIMAMIVWLEERIQADANAASGAAGNVAVVTFDNPT